jgi:hypothetical protein
MFSKQHEVRLVPHKLNKNENTANQNLSNVAKAALRAKCAKGIHYNWGESLK